MIWSQLKKQLEDRLADSIAGRVEIWNTRYRKAHDAYGEAWVTIDKKKVWGMADTTLFKESHLEAVKILGKKPHDNYSPDEENTYWITRKLTDDIMHERGICGFEEVDSAWHELLNLSIDDAIKSKNPIIRAFATIDRRFGRRRLGRFDDTNEHDLVKTLYRFRCEVEGIKKEHKPNNSRPSESAF
jgi:hypothetical protein